jgi:hypothetical protein
MNTDYYLEGDQDGREKKGSKRTRHPFSGHQILLDRLPPEHIRLERHKRFKEIKARLDKKKSENGNMVD